MPLHRRAVHGPVRRKRPARRRRGLAVVGPPDVRRRRSTGTDAEVANCFSRPHAEGAPARSGAGPLPALETKFLLFDVGQEQDSALSLPPRLALGLPRLSLPASSSAALLRSAERRVGKEW